MYVYVSDCVGVCVCEPMYMGMWFSVCLCTRLCLGVYFYAVLPRMWLCEPSHQDTKDI